MPRVERQVTTGHRRLLAAVAALLLVASLIGSVFATDYVWAERLFGHSLALGGAAGLIGAILVSRTASHRRARAVAIGVAVVAGGALLVAGASVLVDGSSLAGVAASPDGRASAVVTAQPWAVDSVYRVTIRQETGLLARQWYAGCLNGDDPANAYESMRWAGPDTLMIRTGDGRELALRTDPSTGQPRDVVHAGITDVCGSDRP